MLELTETNFEAEVLKSDKPVLVDFWAPWCMPCKIIAPTVEELAKKLDGRLKVLKLNVDESPGIATEFSIFNIPTLVLFKGGQEVSRMVGVNSKEALETKISDFL